MRKEKKIICSLGGVREYKIGGVRYIVSSHFSDSAIHSTDTADKRIENHLKSDFAHLTPGSVFDTMSDEYECLTAGKEEICSQN